MEVRIESMICVWDDAIPTMFLEFVNLLTLTTSEGELRKSVKEFAEKHELDKFFLYGFGSHHFYLHQRYMEKPNKFAPFGQKESAHLIYHTIAPLKVLVMGVNFILPF